CRSASHNAGPASHIQNSFAWHETCDVNKQWCPWPKDVPSGVTLVQLSRPHRKLPLLVRIHREAPAQPHGIGASRHWKGIGRGISPELDGGECQLRVNSVRSRSANMSAHVSKAAIRGRVRPKAASVTKRHDRN